MDINDTSTRSPSRSKTYPHTPRHDDFYDDNLSVRSSAPHSGRSYVTVSRARSTESHCGRSDVTRASSTNSAARRDALIEIATSHKALELRKILADKEREMDDELAVKERDFEETRRQIQNQRAEKERQLSILSATQDAAMAEAKLKAIDQAIREEEEEMNTQRGQAAAYSHVERERQTVGQQNLVEDWIHSAHPESEQKQVISTKISSSNPSPVHVITNHEPRNEFAHSQNTRLGKFTSSECVKLPTVNHDIVYSQRVQPTVPSSPQDKITPPCEPIISRDRDATNAYKKHIEGNPLHIPIVPESNQYRSHTQAIEHGSCCSLSATNEHLSATLARQNLPKIEPEVFNDDVTLYFPWRHTFKAMINGTSITPAQELIYLRNFTKGQSQRVVDSYRRRLYDNPENALTDAWNALDTRYGNSAAISHSYIDQIRNAASFDENDSSKLEDFSDICADISSQMSCLPSLTCLNYATQLQPIVNELPYSMRQKWDKIIVEYAEAHDNAYPTFDAFALFVRRQAKLKNHPNILVHKTIGSLSHNNNRTHEYTSNFNQPFQNSARVLSTNIDAEKRTRKPYDATQFCLYHDQNGHDLKNCISFEYKSGKDQSEIVRQLELCSRCLASDHVASDCTVTIKCDRCGSDNHLQPFHFNSRKESSRQSHTLPDDALHSDSHSHHVNSSCTSVCNRELRGLSCSKIVLIDMISPRFPAKLQRIYAIIDDQSNTSLIHPDLIRDLRLDGEEERYYLTTCSSTKSVRYGRRIPSMICRSLSGVEYALPPLLECATLRGDKREVATPDIAYRFPHMRDISTQIPNVDEDAKIMLLIGRDSPELLKVQESRNGPVGSPWAQRLLLGWTILGQVSESPTNNVVHVKAHRTLVTQTDVTRLNEDARSLTPKTSSACDELESITERIEHTAHKKCDSKKDDILDTQSVQTVTDEYTAHSVGYEEHPSKSYKSGGRIMRCLKTIKVKFTLFMLLCAAISYVAMLTYRHQKDASSHSTHSSTIQGL